MSRYWIYVCLMSQRMGVKIPLITPTAPSMADWCHTMGWQQAWDFIVDKTLQHWDSARLRKWSFWNEYERIQTDGLQQWLSSTSPAYYLEDSLVPRHFTDQVEWSASCVHFVWLVIQDVHETWSFNHSRKNAAKNQKLSCIHTILFHFLKIWLQMTPSVPPHRSGSEPQGFERDTACSLYPPLLKSASPPKSTTALPPSLVGTVVISRAPLATWFNGQLCRWQICHSQSCWEVREL